MDTKHRFVHLRFHLSTGRRPLLRLASGKSLTVVAVSLHCCSQTAAVGVAKQRNVGQRELEDGDHCEGCSACEPCPCLCRSMGIDTQLHVKSRNQDAARVELLQRKLVLLEHSGKSPGV